MGVQRPTGAVEAGWKPLTSRVPTWKHVDHLHEVRQEEWDLLVTDQRLAFLTHGGSPAVKNEVAEHLCVIHVSSGNLLSSTMIDVVKGKFVVRVKDGHPGQEMKRVSGLPERLEIVTHEELEPVVLKRDRHQWFDIGGDASIRARNADFRDLQVTSFLELVDGSVLAGRYKRSAQA